MPLVLLLLAALLLPAAVAHTAPLIQRVPRRRVYHKRHDQQYHIEDSRRGVLLAIRLLFGWIDLDVQKSLDGTLWVTHWPRPGEHDGFFDPSNPHWNRHTSIALMHDAQIERLRTHDGYRIRRADDLIIWALKHGIKVEFEAKTPDITVYDFLHLREAIVKAGLDPSHVQVKAYPQFKRSLSGAHRAAFKTIIMLHTEAEAASITRDDLAYLTYARGFLPVVSR